MNFRGTLGRILSWSVYKPYRAGILLLLLLLCLQYDCKQFAKISLDGDLASYSYNGVSSPKEGTYFAAGQSSTSGVIIQSTDYGLNWVSLVSVDTAKFTAITSKIFQDKIYLFATTSKGSVYISRNNGSSWSTVTVVSSIPLNGVSVSSNGWAYVAGSGSICRRASYYTSDFATWSSITSGLNDNTNWFDVSSYGGAEVIIVGSSGRICTSSTNGTSWTQRSSSTTSTIYCVSHGSSSVALAGGDSGYLAKTSDQGATWSVVGGVFSSSYSIKFHSISFQSASEVCVSGSISNSAVIYCSVDNAVTWTQLSSADTQIFSLSMLNSLYGVAGAANGVGILAIVPGQWYRNTTLLC